ncbi:hypothetical protein MGYG_00860 [Nannizzia gypsea CBS 118893]|uniref:Uncharacterized protein n=1 Tax=Arthroderma gypseum (strain ATCC MYA-4604 / CBS 118893) TaxID=535722 RepID=E5R2E8_ARTGP|nr:hypothetical protein MGYG_00860 [Nannizzia gypsea CBS 118893]EFQ97824.1 hypothetical protein MGYG_00860 [Nannizzia gypsea CBS 118893]
MLQPLAATESRPPNLVVRRERQRDGEYELVNRTHACLRFQIRTGPSKGKLIDRFCGRRTKQKTQRRKGRRFLVFSLSMKKACLVPASSAMGIVSTRLGAADRVWDQWQTALRPNSRTANYSKDSCSAVTEEVLSNCLEKSQEIIVLGVESARNQMEECVKLYDQPDTQTPASW